MTTAAGSVGSSHPGHGRSPRRTGGHAHLLHPGESIVHRVPAAPKLAGLVAFVVIAAVTPRHQVPALVTDLVIVAAVAALAGLPVRLVLRRLAVVTPFLVGAVLLPFVATGERVEVAGLDLAVDGLWASWNLVAKTLVGAGAAIVVTATTPLPDLLRGLARLRLPPALVAVVGFMLRYLDVVADQVARMRRAMVARGGDPRWFWQARPLAMSAGALFVRSYEQGERTHQAMLARGFTGLMPDLGAADRPTAASAWPAALPAALALGALAVTGALR